MAPIGLRSLLVTVSLPWLQVAWVYVTATGSHTWLSLDRGSCCPTLPMTSELEKNIECCLFVLTKRCKGVPRVITLFSWKTWTSPCGFVLPLNPASPMRRVHVPESTANGLPPEKTNKVGKGITQHLKNESKNSPCDKTVIKLHLTVSSKWHPF